MIVGSDSESHLLYLNFVFSSFRNMTTTQNSWLNLQFVVEMMTNLKPVRASIFIVRFFLFCFLVKSQNFVRSWIFESEKKTDFLYLRLFTFIFFLFNSNEITVGRYVLESIARKIALEKVTVFHFILFFVLCL